ncbi:MAG: penicillin-binding protein 2 [Firmicutes bacterium]|nr:penicillin-binding protein 2 [Bacillota bacterium]
MVSKKTEDRLRFFWLIVVGIFCILVVRLGALQLVQASDYRTLSEENRVRIIPVRAPRGEIVDRNGVVLARSKQVFSIQLNRDPNQSDYHAVAQQLSALLIPYYPEMTTESILSLIDQSQERRYEPITIKRNVDIQVVTMIEEMRQELPGVSVDVEPLREYPGYGEAGPGMAGHIMGFVREISQEELNQKNQNSDEESYYQLGDLIGKDGLEKQYEDVLRGRDGAKQVEVNVYNRPVRSLDHLKTIPAVPGNTLVLTLDAKLQETLEKSMDENLARLQKSGYPKAKAGSAVVMDVNTGAILAMVSRPALNPNDFIGSMSQEMVDFYYRSNPAAAINRAIAGVYPPGSTFKPITAMAALEANAVKPDGVLVNCTGAYWLSPYIRCWQVHGPTNFWKGMAVSCNTYFQEAGRLAGIENLVRVGEQFGLGRKTGIDLPGEAKGLLPNPQWKRDLNSKLINAQYNKNLQEIETRYQAQLEAAPDDKTRQDLNKKKDNEIKLLRSRYQINYNFNTTWQGFDTLNMSIGQGNNNYTPIQLVTYISAVANGGKVFQPYLVDRVMAHDGHVVQQNSPRIVNQASVSPENIALVRKAMAGVMQPGGTAYFMFTNFPPNIQVGGKTGTAETGRAGDNKERDYHGVFVAFAPADNPQIAFAGLIEYGYHGSESSGYLAKAVFEQYFGIASNTPPPATTTAPETTEVKSNETPAGNAPVGTTEPTGTTEPAATTPTGNTVPTTTNPSGTSTPAGTTTREGNTGQPSSGGSPPAPGVTQPPG